jgi:beta-1,4-mannosyl-glycoprotein beta-1,4-N-acetylglucosaminyltransferase
MNRIFDCFPFFNELDLLEIRLHELSPVVDYFVLAEATTTFTGNPKPLFFHENRTRFAEFLDRIVHVVVDDFPATVRSPWDREIHQRNALKRGLLKSAPDDLIFLSDVDEIVRADAIRKSKKIQLTKFDVLCFELRMYNYFYNCESEERWLRRGPRALLHRHLPPMEKLRQIKGPTANLLQNSLRAIHAWRQLGRPVRRITIRDAGWHFTYIGDVETILDKMRSFSHNEDIPAEMFNPEYLQKHIHSGSSADLKNQTRLVCRPLDDTFPKYLLDNRAKFERNISKGG